MAVIPDTLKHAVENEKLKEVLIPPAPSNKANRMNFIIYTLGNSCFEIFTCTVYEFTSDTDKLWEIVNAEL